MRLVNYGAGELSDRLTILALKILHRGAEGKPIKHFEDERNVLLTQIRTRTLNGVWFEPVLALGAVNAAIWYAEDALREVRLEFNQGKGEDAHKRADDEIAQAVLPVAFRIQELNDQRAGLIEAINKLAGDHLGSEKPS